MADTPWVISADSHVTILPEMWRPYVEARFHDRLPRLVKTADGGDAIAFEGQTESAMLSAELRGSMPKGSAKRAGFIRLADASAGAWDPRARLADQITDGVGAEVIYGGGPPGVSADLGFQVAMFRAYNDWLRDYCAAAPDRLFGVGYVPVYTIELAIAELTRIKGLGHVAALLPTYHDLAPYSEPYWEPVWAAAQELDLPLVFHARTSMHGRHAGTALVDRTSRGGFFAYSNVGACAQFVLACQLLWAGVYQRFPGLKIGHIENNVGWIAYMLERADRIYQHQGTAAPCELSEPPSHYFKRNAFATFIEDMVGVKMRHEIGLENILWGSDFPHGDTTYPDSPATVAEHIANIPEEDGRAMFRDNAIHWYRLNL